MEPPTAPGLVLQALVSGPSLADVPVPACLNHCINQEAFSCKICGEPYDNIHALVDHGKHHLGQANLTCAFCGESWPSFVALSLHQLVWQAHRQCPDCGASIETEKHVCHLAAEKGDKKSVQGRFRCPLLCSKVQYPLEYLKAHLVSFHGCEKTSVEVMKDALGQVQGVKAELGTEAIRCPHCDTRINSNAIKLENHVVLSCSARSESVTKRVSNLVALADEWGEDPLLVVKQEIDASVLHYTSMVESGNYLDKFVQQGLAADRRYDKLPANFSREYLGYTIAEHTLQQLQAEENNLVFKFDIWGQLVEKTAGPQDIRDLIVKFEEELMSVVRSGVTTDWCKMDRDPALLTDMPDSKTLSDLEMELGWMQSECPRDLENTMKQLQVQMKSRV